MEKEMTFQGLVRDHTVGTDKMITGAWPVYSRPEVYSGVNEAERVKMS